MRTVDLIVLALFCWLSGCFCGALAICLGLCAARGDRENNRIPEDDHADA